MHALLSLVLVIASMAPVRAGAEALATASDATQRYEAYTPDGYPGTRRWPLLILLDPRGRADAALDMARPAAKANGWIVLSAYGSRSDDREQRTFDALQALLREAGARYAYDPKRVYIAGMSGTAKSLWVADRALHGLVAGYIGAGGGRPPELGPLKPGAAPPWFGFAGNADFNYREMRELDAALAQAGGVHRLAVFEGRHGWPRAEGAFGEAIDWFELQAMRSGTAARREEWIDAQLQSARARAAAASTPLERWRALDQLARDFDGLRPVDAERGQAATLAAGKELRDALAKEQRLLAEEARFARALDDWAARLNAGTSESGRLPPPDTARTLASLRIRSLRERSHDPDPLVADSATRRLELAFAAGAHYLADEQQGRGNEEGARAALRVAAAIYPEHPYPACRLEGLANKRPLAESVAACGSTPVQNAR
jgi:predicted esterase